MTEPLRIEIACHVCGEPLEQQPTGRRRRYCGPPCRQRAYRRRTGPVAHLAPRPYRSGQGWALHLGDASRVLADLPSGSVQCVVTSPPYYNLRDYRGHPDQLGQEATPAQYVEHLAEVFSQIRRVLRPDGTVWLNLGDTYASRSNTGPSADRHGGRGHRGGVMPSRVNTTAVSPMKSLLMVPARVAIALSDAGWIIRNQIIWHKTNAMPHSVSDRLNNSHEYLYLLAKNPSYYFDLDAIRIPARRRDAGTGTAAQPTGITARSPLSTKIYETRNPGDVWPMATRASSEDHYAMFPDALPRRCIEASTRPGDIVLDPFAGRSTTGRVALALGRRYIGIDINAVDHDAAASHLDLNAERHAAT